MMDTSKFKSREEYEEWKKNRAQTSPPLQPITEKKEGKQRKIFNKRNLFVVLIFFGIVVIFITFLEWNKKKSEYELYKKEGLSVIAEIERLSSSLEIGMTFIDYKKRLGDINYPVKMFREKFQFYTIEGYSPMSYQGIDQSMKLYLNISDKWEAAIKSGNDTILSITKDHIGRGWAIIASDLKLSRLILEEQDKDKRKNLIRELINVFNLWNEEDKAYHQRI